jgi:glutaredoxin
MDVVIYCRADCADSQVLRDYLDSLGVDYRLCTVQNGDARATREWEDLDGEVTPLVVIDRSRIVRGLDRARLDQHLGWIGC